MNLLNYGKEIERNIQEISITGDWGKNHNKKIEEVIVKMKIRYESLRKVKIRMNMWQAIEITKKIDNINTELIIDEEIKEIEIEKTMNEIKKCAKMIKEIELK